MLPLLLLMLPAAAAAVGSGECEHSTLLQKNLASLKALKVTEAPALFAAKGLNMTTAKDTLQMAAKNVSEAVKNAQATLEAKELNIDTLESFKSDSTHELEKVFEAMKVQLRKGIEQLQPALKALNLSSSATSLQNMSETAEKEINKMKDGSDLVELHGTDVAATVWEGKAFLTQAFQNWTKSATKELLDQVSSKERELLETYTKEKVSSATSIVDDMLEQAANFIAAICAAIEDVTLNIEYEEGTYDPMSEDDMMAEG
ncbi:unnamed protein product [Durusdinium trenchii]|uniref:Uncharacterized protein n=2 Tax=Durusdinium trenchii TaxID=1381693 RepID=A0ABP0LDW7_9DINO